MAKGKKIISRSPSGVFLIGSLFLIAGLILLFGQIYGASIFFLLVGVAFYSIRQGIKADVEEEKIKKYLNIFGFSFGKWQDVHNPKHVAIVRVKKLRKMGVPPVKANYDMNRFKVNLIHGEDEYVTITTEKHDKAIDDAKKVAHAFNVKIMDTTNPKKKVVMMEEEVV
ncbi:MAG: hypothetical protein ACOCUL_01905 [Bacteroidota bacterium]